MKGVSMRSLEPGLTPPKCKGCFAKPVVRLLQFGQAQKVTIGLCPDCIRVLREEIAREANPAILAAIEKGLLLSVRPEGEVGE